MTADEALTYLELRLSYHDDDGALTAEAIKALRLAGKDQERLAKVETLVRAGCMLAFSPYSRMFEVFEPDYKIHAAVARTRCSDLRTALDAARTQVKEQADGPA